MCVFPQELQVQESIDHGVGWVCPSSSTIRDLLRIRDHCFASFVWTGEVASHIYALRRMRWYLAQALYHYRRIDTP